ncbi:hypothetical protein VOLCADRAFT_115568, partial [Volvox carteri f. nagariensis]
MASRDNDVQQQPGQLKNALYLQPKVASGVHAPKAAKKYAQAQAAAQMSATRSLAPLEATAGFEKAQQIRSTLNALGAKKAPVLEKLKQTPQSPKTDVPPLDKPLPAVAPPLRGSGRRRDDGNMAASPPRPPVTASDMVSRARGENGNGHAARLPNKQELGEGLPYV